MSVQQELPAVSPPASSARLRDEQRDELKRHDPVNESTVDLVLCGAGGYDEVQAPLYAHPVLQDGRQQEGLAGIPA